MLSVSYKPTLHRLFPCAMLAQTDPDNIAQEEILFNVVLILLGQHCTGKNLVQSSPKGSRKTAYEKLLILFVNTV